MQRQVAVIIVPGSTALAFAARAATEIVPIVFTTGIDPIKSGLVTSLNKPGGNLTGIYQLSNDLTARRFEFLRELVPSITVFALLVNPTNAIAANSAADELRPVKAHLSRHSLLRPWAVRRLTVGPSTASPWRLCQLGHQLLGCRMVQVLSGSR
jgi:hypothetical protein